MGFLENWKEKKKEKRKKYYETYYKELDYQKLCNLMMKNMRVECKVTVTVGDQLEEYAAKSLLGDIPIYYGSDTKGNQFRFTEGKEDSVFTKGEKITIYGRMIERLKDKTMPTFFVYYYKKGENEL